MKYREPLNQGGIINNQLTVCSLKEPIEAHYLFYLEVGLLVWRCVLPLPGWSISCWHVEVWPFFHGEVGCVCLTIWGKAWGRGMCACVCVFVIRPTPRQASLRVSGTGLYGMPSVRCQSDSPLISTRRNETVQEPALLLAHCPITGLVRGYQAHHRGYGWRPLWAEWNRLRWAGGWRDV